MESVHGTVDQIHGRGPWVYGASDYFEPLKPRWKAQILWSEGVCDWSNLSRCLQNGRPGSKAGEVTVARVKMVDDIMAPLAPCEPGWVTTVNSHSSEQGTLPSSSLISKQVITYQTHGNTCCSGVSTTKTQSLANSSMTNHKSWRSQPSPPFQTLLKPQHWTSPQSHHIMTDGRPTLSTLNITKMERLV
jgi:hypothetical protein